MFNDKDEDDLDLDVDGEGFKIHSDPRGNWCIYIGDSIESDTHAYSDLYYALDMQIGPNDNVSMFLSCWGGNVPTMQRICASMRRCPGFITVYVDSHAQSAGALIAISGNALVLAKDAFLMFHTGATGVYADVSDIQLTVEQELKWYRQNDELVCKPFLTQGEIDSMYSEGKEIKVWGSDTSLKARIKRHFK